MKSRWSDVGTDEEDDEGYHSTSDDVQSSLLGATAAATGLARGKALQLLVAPSRSVPVVFWALTTSVVSIVLTLGNKAVLRSWEWPLTLMMVQNAWAALFTFVAVLSGAPFEPISMKQVCSLALTATMTATATGTILVALPHTSIATLTVFGSAKALVQASAEGLFCRAKFGPSELACLALIFGAGLWYGAQDATTTMSGYFFLTANLAISVSRGIVQRWTYSTMRQSVIGIAAIESTLSLPLIVALCFASGEWRSAAPLAGLSGEPSLFMLGLMKPWHSWAESDALTWKCLVLVTSFFVGFIGISYTQLFRYLAATTVTVIGSVDKTIAVVAGAFLFGDHIGVGQAAALALTLVAGGAYVFLRKHRLQIARAASEPGGAFEALEGDSDDAVDADAALLRYPYSAANGAAESEDLLRRLEMVAANRGRSGDGDDDADGEGRHRGGGASDVARDLERGSRDATRTATRDASGDDASSTAPLPLRSLGAPTAGRSKSPRRRSNLSPSFAPIPTAEHPTLVGLSAALGEGGARSPRAGGARSPTPEQLHTIARRALGETQVVTEMETLLAQAFDKGRAAVKSGDITRSELHLIKERLEKIRRAPAHSPSLVTCSSRGGAVVSPQLSPLNLGGRDGFFRGRSRTQSQSLNVTPRGGGLSPPHMQRASSSQELTELGRSKAWSPSDTPRGVGMRHRGGSRRRGASFMALGSPVRFRAHRRKTFTEVQLTAARDAALYSEALGR